MTTKEEAMTPTERVRIEVISGEEEEVGPTIQTHLSLSLESELGIILKYSI